MTKTIRRNFLIVELGSISCQPDVIMETTKATGNESGATFRLGIVEVRENKGVKIIRDTQTLAKPLPSGTNSNTIDKYVLGVFQHSTMRAIAAVGRLPAETGTSWKNPVNNFKIQRGKFVGRFLSAQSALPNGVPRQMGALFLDQGSVSRQLKIIGYRGRSLTLVQSATLSP